MAETTREPNPTVFGTPGESEVRLHVGVVYVPCVGCLTPLDLARVVPGEGPLCDRCRDVGTRAVG
jgi:hypothetical protein